MGAELTTELSADVELIPASGGVFEVTADDKLIFSKKALKRFPEQGEIVDLIRNEP